MFKKIIPFIITTVVIISMTSCDWGEEENDDSSVITVNINLEEHNIIRKNSSFNFTLYCNEEQTASYGSGSLVEGKSVMQIPVHTIQEKYYLYLKISNSIFDTTKYFGTSREIILNENNEIIIKPDDVGKEITFPVHLKEGEYTISNIDCGIMIECDFYPANFIESPEWALENLSDMNYGSAPFLGGGGQSSSFGDTDYIEIQLQHIPGVYDFICVSSNMWVLEEDCDTNMYIGIKNNVNITDSNPVELNADYMIETE